MDNAIVEGNSRSIHCGVLKQAREEAEAAIIWNSMNSLSASNTGKCSWLKVGRDEGYVGNGGVIALQNMVPDVGQSPTEILYTETATYDSSAETTSCDVLLAPGLLKNAPTAALLGASTVMAPVVGRLFKNGPARLASCDSCVLLARTSWSDCPRAVEANAKVRAANFMVRQFAG